MEHVSALQRHGRTIVLCCAVASMIGLRVAALASDPYTRLDWSAGLLTDEGFYVHNARNVVLFGHARTDDFNNMLLSPMLHVIQVCVFSLFGVGAVQARSISIVCSLFTLVLLYAALRRSFGNRIAVTAALFLGLDHANLLYNRMALMDTPAALPAVAAFYAFVRGVAGDESRVTARAGGGACPAPTRLTPGLIWLVLCGVLVGVTVVNRMLCAYLLPVPLIALLQWYRDGRATRGYAEPLGNPIVLPRRQRVTALLAVACAMTGVLGIYLVSWYLPHRSEIVPMTRYYRVHQLQPASLAHLAENLQHALFGDFRGLAPYLFRHTPVLFVLALLGIGCSGVQAFRHSGIDAYLVAWLLLGWGVLAVISYSPSRYYVTTYPAMAALAAIALWQLPEQWVDLWGLRARPRIVRGALAGFLTFHAVLAVVHFHGILPRLPTGILLYGLPPVAVLGVQAFGRSGVRVFGRYAASLLITCWVLVDAYWLGDWVGRIAYTQRQMSQWLAQNLPVGSVLIGDVAAGVSLDNPFRVVHVQPGLCNWHHPVEKEDGAPRYVVILDGRWKEAYWLKNYPELVAPARRIQFARVLRWQVGVYAVDAAGHASAR